MREIVHRGKARTCSWTAYRSEFAHALEVFREKAGFNLREVAAAAGVSLATVSRAERGEQVNGDNLMTLAFFAGIDLTALAGIPVDRAEDLKSMLDRLDRIGKIVRGED